MPTSVLVRQADRAEGLLRQVEIVICTIEVLGSVFLEELAHKILARSGETNP